MGVHVTGITKQRRSLALEAYSTNERVLGQRKCGKEDLSVACPINSWGELCS
jgi:hypothetical protein